MSTDRAGRDRPKSIPRMPNPITNASSSAGPLAIPIPPLAYRERFLDNGLRVLTVEDHTSPNASVQVWYRVGSKNDPQGRSGFAHLFEHLMFKSTKHMRAEQMDELTEAVGGANNASTGGDYTNYFEVVPSNHVQRLLWAEAERMANLEVDAANFESERAVVEEEYRQRVLAAPYGRLFNAIDPDSYRVHPYRRPGIGSIPELEAASLQDVVEFHRLWYRPDGATLIVVGDFDQGPLDGWIERYFGALRRPKARVPVVAMVEPEWTRNRHRTRHGPNVPLPAIVETWLIPPAADADAAPLRVAAAVLGRGESSRLHQALVYREQSATEVDFEADLRADQGLIYGFAIVASGRDPAAVRLSMRNIIRKLAADGVPDAELDRVKIRILTDALRRRQTPMGIGFALGEATLVAGDPARADADLAAIAAVTSADVQRVIRRWLVDAHSVAIDYSRPRAPRKPRRRDAGRRR